LSSTSESSTYKQKKHELKCHATNLCKEKKKWGLRDLNPGWTDGNTAVNRYTKRAWTQTKT